MDGATGKERSELASEFLAALVQSSDDAIISKSPEGKVLSWNKGAERIFGWTAEEIIGRSVSTIIPPELAGEEKTILARLAAGERIEHFETVRLHKDGSRRDVSLSVSPIRDRSGAIVGISKIARDIGDRRRAEETLAERARMLDQSHDAILVRNLDDRISYWNQGAHSLYGWTGKEALGQIPHQLLRSIYPVPLAQVRATVQERGFWDGEVRQTTKSGKNITVLARWMRNTNSKGEPTGVIQHHTDITDRKRMEADLAQANEELSRRTRRLEDAVAERTKNLQGSVAELERVSYSLSHDLRAPLRTILSFSQIVLTEAGDRLNAMEKGLLAKSVAASSRLDRLIQDVLTYSRVARDAIHLDRIDVEALLLQIIDERPEYQPPRARIEIQRPLHPVYGHEAYLTQCITNLLDNAVKFVPPGTTPKILIREEARDGHVRLWFEDNGIGIPLDAQKRIFEMFQRAHEGLPYPGTGIGLSIVRKAVERMEGAAGVESEPGNGSRFWLELRRDAKP